VAAPDDRVPPPPPEPAPLRSPPPPLRPPPLAGGLGVHDGLPRRLAGVDRRGHAARIGAGVLADGGAHALGRCQGGGRLVARPVDALLRRHDRLLGGGHVGRDGVGEAASSVAVIGPVRAAVCDDRRHRRENRRHRRGDGRRSPTNPRQWRPLSRNARRSATQGSGGPAGGRVRGGSDAVRAGLRARRR
jgi:hypothetical protein